MATPRSPDPRAVDQHVIDELADELHCASDLVAEIYLHEADGLARTARVPEFISVFAARRTRERLRRNRRGR